MLSAKIQQLRCYFQVWKKLQNPLLILWTVPNPRAGTGLTVLEANEHFTIYFMALASFSESNLMLGSVGSGCAWLSHGCDRRKTHTEDLIGKSTRVLAARSEDKSIPYMLCQDHQTSTLGSGPRQLSNAERQSHPSRAQCHAALETLPVPTHSVSWSCTAVSACSKTPQGPPACATLCGKYLLQLAQSGTIYMTI